MVDLGGVRDAPPGSKFLHFHAVFRQNWLNNRFAPPEVDPPPLGNPGSATAGPVPSFYGNLPHEQTERQTRLILLPTCPSSSKENYVVAFRPVLTSVVLRDRMPLIMFAFISSGSQTFILRWFACAFLWGQVNILYLASLTDPGFVQAGSRSQIISMFLIFFSTRIC